MKSVILLLILKVTTSFAANGPGSVFIHLLSYDNILGRADDGIECDSWLNGWVRDKCDFVFEVCLEDLPKTKQNSRCNVGSLSTLSNVFANTFHVKFQDYIGFIPNPFNFSLRSIPKDLNIQVDVSDDDIGGLQRVSKLSRSIRLPIIGPDESPDYLAPLELRSKYSDLRLKVYGRCKKFYYGTGCNQYCKPSNSRVEGFYACDKKTGEKHCLIGWTGENCRQRDMCVMENNPCHGSAVCSMNGSMVACQCPESLTGQHCQTPKLPCDSNPCLNGGLCIRNPDASVPDTRCDCPRNFTDLYCQRDVDECFIFSPCQNEGSCVNYFGSYRCVCKNNHWGINCEKPPVFSVDGTDLAFVAGNDKEKFLQKMIVLLLIVVICLIFIASLFSVLYYKKRFAVTHASSLGSIYTECHFGDKVTNATDVDQYVNHYELEPENYEKVDCNIDEEVKEKDSMLIYCDKVSVI